MMTYSEIETYFQTQKTASGLERVFQLFLHLSDMTMTNETLQAEFSTHHVFPLVRENGTLVSGIELLRRKRDNQGIPVLAYALAGDAHISRLQWLLGILGQDVIQTYANLQCSLMAMVAFSGAQNRLELLLQYYQPTENEYVQGLFSATYYGHIHLVPFILEKINSIKRQNIQPEVDVHALRDAEGNTCLHIAVLGSKQQSIDFFARNATQAYLDKLNNRQYKAVDEAVLANNKHIVIQIAYIYSLRQTDINYNDLIFVLIRRGTFYDAQKEMLLHLRQHHTNAVTSIEDWIRAAIDVNNEAIVKEFIIDLPHYLDINSLITYANSNNRQSIVSLLSEEQLAKQWIRELMEIILARLSAYIYRQKYQLDQLARDDRLPEKSYKETKHPSDAPRRLSECQQALSNLFYGSYFNELKQLYKALPTHSRNISLLSEKIILQRQTLTQKIRVSNKDIVGFNKIIQEAINMAAGFLIVGFDSTPDVISTEPVDRINSSQMSEISYEDDGSDDEMPRFTEKQMHFVNRFVEQFDQTYQLYKCLSSGNVVKKPDEIDRLAEIAKTVAIGVLPDINVSAPMFGVPLPFSISLPSGIAVAAVIDLLMFIRDQTEQNQAQRAGRFFDSWTLRDRVNGIYECAEFLATRFRDQIGLLSHNESIPRMADMAVARIFRHAMGSNGHTVSRAPSKIGTLFRYVASTIVNVGPEPEVIRKSLIEISVDALSKYEHRVFAWDREDERFLILDEQISQGRFRDWTVKGIFEHTGIRSNGISYKGMNQNVQKYGYAYSSKDEIRNRGMRPTNDIPDFEIPVSRAASTKTFVS